MAGAKVSRLLEIPPAFAKKDRVTVTEPGIRPWHGTVTAVKPSSQSGWWYEVRRDDGGTWVIQQGHLEMEKGVSA